MEQYYKVGRNQFIKVEVKNEGQANALKELNRDFDRRMKADIAYSKRCRSLEFLSFAYGFDLEDEKQDIENQVLEEERKEELKQRVHKAISELKPRQQEFVKLIFFEGYSQEEIAVKYGITKQAVSNAMQRIYDSLKKSFEKI